MNQVKEQADVIDKHLDRDELPDIISYIVVKESRSTHHRDLG